MLDIAPSPQTPRYAFDTYDKVTIDDIAYRPCDITDNGYVLVRVDGGGKAVHFTRAEMSRLVDTGSVKHERDAFLPETAKARLEAPSQMLSMLPDKQHRTAKGKENVVRAFLELEREGAVKRVDASIQVALNEIMGRAAKYSKAQSHFDEGKKQAGTLVVPEFCARSLRRWLTSYERHGIAGLIDGTSQRGNHSRRLCPETQLLLGKCVAGYMTREKKTQRAIFDDVKRVFAARNEELRAEGMPELVRPSKETVRQAILALDPYQCDVAREGLEKARRKHAPVGAGLDLTRPLQRVEMDTWKVDLISLLADSGLLHFMSEEEKGILGLNGKKKRWWLTVAMCATTRCILAMRLSRNPSQQGTIQALDMIMQDKGVWSDAVGALSSWHMRGTPPYVYTDCGKEYVSYDVEVAGGDVGMNIEHAPAGHPEMRARIERLFKTISINLMPRLTGRTFSNMIERGDYDSKGRAALTADDLCNVLIRWVVDIYHRMPHEGLDGETPAKCWDRLTERYGVVPPADVKSRRVAFGTRMSCKASKDGITILGIRYQSQDLARRMLRRRNRDVNVRWYSEDLGAIAVEVGGEWIEVPSVFQRFKGVRAQTHIAARRALQSRFKHEAVLQEDIVFQTIDDIEAINGNAMRRVGLLVDDWSQERLQREEEKLFIGFRIEHSDETEAKSHVEPSYGEDLTAELVGAQDHVTEKNEKCAAGVSGAAASNESSVRDHRPAQSDDGADEPDFEFEDKK